MKLAWTLVPLFFAPGSLAQDTALVSAIATLPSCALRCLVNAMSQSSIPLTDQTRVCADTRLQSYVESCVLGSCTVKESLTTKRITSSLCEVPTRDRSGRLKAINIVLAVLSNVAGAVRYTYKIITPGQDLGLDDFSLMVANYVGLSCAIVIDRGTIPSGLGKDIWTLDFTAITNFGKYFYIMEVLYFVELTSLKLSLLFFYRRIFPDYRITTILNGTIAFTISFGIAFTIAGIFQCQPIAFYWTKWDGVQAKGKCFNINALAWANAAISIALDFWMLAIPLSQIIHLKMALKKKIAVGLMFGVGTFVTVVSILRLHSLIDFANSTNPTWDQWDVSHWSIVEINVGIICACMPTFRVLLARYLPKMFGSTVGSSERYTTPNLRNIMKGEEQRNAMRIEDNVASHSRSKSQSSTAMTSVSRHEDDEIELVGR